MPQFLSRRFAAAAAAGVLSLGGAAFGATTTIEPSVGPGEPSHETIFENLYGGNFTGSVGTGFTNGTITAVRVQDTGGGTLNLNGGSAGASDQFFTGNGPIRVEAVARFAAAQQSFGFLPGTSGGSYTELFDTAGNGYSLTGSATIDASGETWRFARTGPSQNQSSAAEDNPKDLDQLVTYEILGEGRPTYLLFWEDRSRFTSVDATLESDRDFNDLIVKVSAIPLPAAAWMGLSMLGAVIGNAAWKRSRKATV